MTYEAMLQAPLQQIESAGAKLSLRVARDATLRRPSASIDPAAFASVATRRPDFWKTLLSETEIKRIEHVASAIFPEWRTHWKHDA